jgi:hypothetical protein
VIIESLVGELKDNFGVRVSRCLHSAVLQGRDSGAAGLQICCDWWQQCGQGGGCAQGDEEGRDQGNEEWVETVQAGGVGDLGADGEGGSDGQGGDHLRDGQRKKLGRIECNVENKL